MCDKHTYRTKIGQNRNDQERDSVHKAYKRKPKKSVNLLSRHFPVRQTHIVPYLEMKDVRSSACEELGNTNDVFRIRSQSDVGTFRMLPFQLLCDDMSIRNRSHACKSVVLSLSTINLVPILFDGGFRTLEFLSAG